MLTDARLNALAESHYDLEQDRSDKECAQADHRASRLAEIQEPLERRMVRAPTPDEFSQAMSNILPVDAFGVSFMWQFPHGSAQKRFEEIGRALDAVMAPELRKLADIAAEERLQAEEHEQEAEALRARRVRLGDEL